MPDSLATVAGIFDRFLSVLGLIRESRIRRDEQTEQALFALYTALTETKVYISNLDSGGRRNREHEHKIAFMWHKSSIPLRHIDRDLSERCFIKGSFWMDPDSWTQARINRNRIALDQVLESTRKLLLS